jgi:hypothetical protein
MVKHYAYRMDHDTGFAPNTAYGLCSLSGCKVTTVERWAKPGSWVIGIGGKGTSQPDKLLYAMEVIESLSLQAFTRRYPRKSLYLRGKAVPNVLISRHFWYFGNRAIELPPYLHLLIVDRQGCKRVAHQDIVALEKYLMEGGLEPGVYGRPNNSPGKSSTGPRGCLC